MSLHTVSCILFSIVTAQFSFMVHIRCYFPSCFLVLKLVFFVPLHVMDCIYYVFMFGRGTDIMDSAIYCRWIPAHCTSHCVARSSSRGKPQGIFASSGILAWGHWRHGTPCCGWWIDGHRRCVGTPLQTEELTAFCHTVPCYSYN